MTQSVHVEMRRLYPDSAVPTFQSNGAAGTDLHAHFGGPDNLAFLDPGETRKIRTGIAVWIKDPNVCGLVFARSGLSVNQDLGLANGVAVIDSDYQGEIVVALHNRGTIHRTVRHGDRIAQLVLVPILLPMFELRETDFSATTDRNAKGFGSTGR